MARGRGSGLHVGAGGAAGRGAGRSGGVVRDLSVPVDDTPRRSPDGCYEAFVQGGNVVLRTLASGDLSARRQRVSRRIAHAPHLSS